jgi:hypothetical protein
VLKILRELVVLYPEMRRRQRETPDAEVHAAPADRNG